MIIQIVQLGTDLSEDDLLEIALQRAPQFRAVPGLVQKYYVVGKGRGNSLGSICGTPWNLWRRSGNLI